MILKNIYKNYTKCNNVSLKWKELRISMKEDPLPNLISGVDGF